MGQEADARCQPNVGSQGVNEQIVGVGPRATPQSTQDRERDTRSESGAQFSMMDRGDTLVFSDEEPLVPCSRNSVEGSTVSTRTGGLLQAGVKEESQFVRNVAPRVDERRNIDPTQWESGAQFSVGSRPVEFQSQCQPDIATPSPQRRTRCDSSEDSLSDTATCTHFPRRRRLSLVWNVEGAVQQVERATVVPLDSHDERLDRVRRVVRQKQDAAARAVQIASGDVRSLAERIGYVEGGADTTASAQTTVVGIQCASHVGCSVWRQGLCSVAMVIRSSRISAMDGRRSSRF